MVDNADFDFEKQRIFEFALQIARLQCNSCYLDERRILNFLGRDDVESYITEFRRNLEFEAKNALMRGICE